MKLSQEFFSKDYFFGKKKSNYYNYNWWDKDSKWKHIIKAVEKNKISGKVLDIGCAFGFLLKRLRLYFRELHGLDISGYAVERARKEVPSAKLEILNIDTDELPYSDEYFDLITALDVLEHTQSIEKNLKKIVKKLKKDGYLIVTVPIKDSWAGRIFSFFDKDYSHISVLPKIEIYEAIDEAGLKIIEKRFFLNLIFFKLKYVPVGIELLLQKK